MKDRNKFILENHNLIYQFAKNNKISLNEYYDLLAIALIKAADTFDIDKGFKFSTYAFAVMKNQYLMEIRKNKRDCLKHSYSLDNIVVDDISFVELCVGEKDVKNKYLDDFRKFLDNLEDKEKKILFYLIKEYNQEEIAEIMNLTQSAISKQIIAIRKKYKQLINEGELQWKK